MATLWLRFRVDLHDVTARTSLMHYGPLFHRWLPDGNKDAISVEIGHPNYTLKVWFERSGYVERGFIQFDKTRKEIDPAIIPRQAILEAGPLFGLLEIRDVPEEKAEPIRNIRIGDQEYVNLGKQLVDILFPRLSRFLDILRIHYGQYWISELKKWDSRDESLGSYCQSTLHLEWSLDSGKTWSPFVPDEDTAVLRLVSRIGRSFREYLSMDDWQEIARLVQEGYQLSLAAIILNRAHQLADHGDLRSAFIEGVTALEIAMHKYIDDSVGGDEVLKKAIQSFRTLPRRTQVAIIANRTGRTSPDDLKHAIKAIDIRDNIVHEGRNPSMNDETKHMLYGLFRVIAAFLPGPEFRFPTINPGNRVGPVEAWERDEKAMEE